MQLSASRLKWITSLQQKKFRDEERVFLAEGKKVIGDLVKNGWKPQYIVVEEGKEELFPEVKAWNAEIAAADAIRMKKISSLATPPGIVAVFPLPDARPEEAELSSPVCLLLDGIGDPGNMGTILRTAHWFGVTEIFLAHHCTDPFAPKVVQATMGSLAKVKLYTISDDNAFAERVKQKGMPVCVADMAGKPFREAAVQNSTLLVLGSESHGVSKDWKDRATTVLQIPPVHASDHPESLNVAVSAAILLSHLCAR
jgi:TrmH family RNA methyltransferase